MSAYTQEQFDRLPRWARDEIAGSHRKVQELRTQLLEMAAENTGTDTFVEAGSGFDSAQRINLPAHSTVTFVLGPARHEKIEVRVGNNGFQKYLHVAGDSTIAVFPRSSNLAYITTPKRSESP